VTDHPSEPPLGPPLEPADASDPRPTEAEEAGVRRLLAEARHDEPMPAAVAARLDEALAGLRDGTASTVREPGSEPVGAPRSEPVREPVRDRASVADLGARRRRAGRLLVAAAAAVVVGVGVGAVHDHLGTAGGSSSTTSASGGSALPRSAGADASGSAGGGGTASGAHGPAYLPQSLGKPVRLVPSRFAQQVRALGRGGAPRALTGQPDASNPAPAPGQTATNGPRSEAGHAAAAGSACVPGGVRDPELVPVRYAGSPGILAFRAPSGDSQVVDLYLCGQARPVRSVTLPVR
jgi:hypothetical protein